MSAISNKTGEVTQPDFELTLSPEDDNFNNPVILAIDPGTNKVGWAVVEPNGSKIEQGILILDDGIDQLARKVDPSVVRTVVIGDGTNRMNIEADMLRLFPRAKIVVVNEKGSTVEAWDIKRRKEAGRNPFRHLLFFLVQLFGSIAVDDYAALVLAKRYLAQLEEDSLSSGDH